MEFNKITAAEAAALIENGQTIGLSGFTPAGTPKCTPAEIAKKAEAQKKMSDASIIEMAMQALPKIVSAAAGPLEHVDKITMYGDGCSTKLVQDIVNSTSQITEGIREATGIDMSSLIAGYLTGKHNN